MGGGILQQDVHGLGNRISTGEDLGAAGFPLEASSAGTMQLHDGLQHLIEVNVAGGGVADHLGRNHPIKPGQLRIDRAPETIADLVGEFATGDEL